MKQLPTPLEFPGEWSSRCTLLPMKKIPVSFAALGCILVLTSCAAVMRQDKLLGAMITNDPDFEIVSLVDTDRLLNFEGTTRVVIRGRNAGKQYFVSALIEGAKIQLRPGGVEGFKRKKVEIIPSSVQARHMADALNRALPTLTRHEAHNAKLLIAVLQGTRKVEIAEWQLSWAE